MTARGASRSNAFIFLCLVCFFDAMGVGLIIPVMPELIVELSELPISSAAEIGGYLMFTFSLVLFFMSPVLGGLSDRYGRRPVLLISLLGFSLDYFIMALAPTLLWLFVARFFSGMFGATLATANAAMVDLSAPEDRARNFGYLGAAVGVGFMFGPVMGGVLGEYGARVPFIASGILILLVCLYGYFAFPETLEAENRRAFEWRRANPFGSLLAIGRYPAVLWIFVALFFIQLAAQSYNSIWSFFLIEVLDWTPMLIGISLAVYGALLAAFQGGLTGIVVKRFGEVRVTLFSIGLGIIVYLGFAFTSQGWQLYFWLVVGAFGVFAIPSMQSLMTQHVPENAQGELQGAIASSYSLSAIIGPIVMTQTFSWFTRNEGWYFPGAPFAAGAALDVISIAIFVYAVRKLTKLSPSNIATAQKT